MATFKWDSSVLKPNSFDLDIEGQSVTLHEFPREQVLEFVREAGTLDVLEEVVNPFFDPDSPIGPGNQEKIMQPRGVIDIEAERFPLVCKYLSIATRGTKSPEFFADLGLPARAYGHLMQLLFDLNALTEILQVSGNYMALPGLLPDAAATNPPEATGQA